MRNRRESEIHQVQLQAILEGRENVVTPGLASRKTNERHSQMPKAASKRRRSPSVPSRKSPRLGKQNDGSSNLEGNGCQENDTEGCTENGQGSSFACTQCKYKTAKKSHFEKHLGSKTHQNKVALEVVASASAVVDSGCPSKETVSQEENDLGAQPTSNNRMNTSRASAVKARTRCAKIAEEEEE